jgi:hypothetical protein
MDPVPYVLCTPSALPSLTRRTFLSTHPILISPLPKPVGCRLHDAYCLPLSCAGGYAADHLSLPAASPLPLSISLSRARPWSMEIQFLPVAHFLCYKYVSFRQRKDKPRTCTL